MSQQTRIENAKQNGYSLDLGEVISQSLENYKKIAMTAGAAVLVISLIFIGLLIVGVGLMVGFGDVASKMTEFNVNNFSTLSIILYIAGTTFLAALMYPITAGVIKMAHEAEMRRPINFSMAFDHYKSEYFKTLFATGLIISLGTNTIAVLFQYLHLDIWGTIATYIIAFFTVFAIPLVIFGKQNAMDAITGSFALVIKQPFVILIALLVSIIIAMLGLIALCIGIFFTLPIVYSTYYILYKKAVGIENNSEIEEIGFSPEI